VVAQTPDEFFEKSSCLRWRNKTDSVGQVIRKPDGTIERESNAVLVEFADGTKKFIVGKKEYDVTYVPFESRFLFTPIKPTIQESGNKYGHLECIGKIPKKLVLNAPEGIKFHKANGDKKPKIKMVNPRDGIENPEIMKEMKIKQEELLRRKEEKRKQSAQQRDPGGGRRSSMSTSYLEEDDDHMKFDSTSLADLKKKAKAGKFVDDERSEDDDEDDDDSFIEKDSASGNDENENEEDDDVESEEGSSKPAEPTTSGRKESRTVIMSDDEEEEDKDMIQSRKRSRKSVLNDSDEED
jgi:Leo1-like protein